jgi:hypothetical protein
VGIRIYVRPTDIRRWVYRKEEACRYICAMDIFYCLRYRYLFVSGKPGWYDVAEKLELGLDPCHKNDGKLGMLIW